MITLHILGAGGAIPTATHGPAAYWVEVDAAGLLLDPGPGALVRLVRQPGTPDSVDAVDTVLLSHLHLDHTADLGPLLFAAHSVLARNPVPLQLAGPPGLADFLCRLQDLYGDWLEPRARSLTVRELQPGEHLDLGGGRATAFAVRHPETRFSQVCLGFVFSDGDGRTAVYSGDTEPCPELTAASRGSDLLVVECSTPDDLASPGHMCPARVAALGREAHPRRIVLTHMYPTVVDADPAGQVSRACGIPCQAARDGLVVTVPDTAAMPEETP